MKKFVQELAVLLVLAIPYVYMAMIWNKLPESVATHFDMSGNPNGWTERGNLPLTFGVLSVVIYLAFLLIPVLDPKKKIAEMGNKFYIIRLITSVFISGIIIYTLYISQGYSFNPSLLNVFLGAFFTIIGLYLRTVKWNYFIGFRTPWTLENEETWNKTHKLGGVLWTAGGIVIILAGLLLKDKSIAATVFGVTTIIIALIPIVYSYVEYKRLHK